MIRYLIQTSTLTAMNPSFLNALISCLKDDLSMTIKIRKSMNNKIIMQ